MSTAPIAPFLAGMVDQAGRDHGALFSDVPEALANTLVVAQRTAFMPPKRKPILPSLAGDKEGEARMCAEVAHRPGRAVAAYYPEACHAELAQVLCAGPDVELAAGDFPLLAEAGVPRKCSTIARGSNSRSASSTAWALAVTS
jgi:hypothetical protein